MEVTEVKVKLVQANRDRLKAYCTMTLDGEFVVRDLKLIEGAHGLFVAMPSRKLADRCPKCGGKNHLRARYCNDCGNHLDESRAGTDREGRPKLHADIAHPINSQCRERIQAAIEQSYHEEVERSKQPGYRPVDLDEPEDTDYSNGSSHHAPRAESGGGGGPEASQPAEQADQDQAASEEDHGDQQHRFGEGIL